MALTWSSRLATGLDWQDAQHQELFKRINTLLDAIQEGRRVESVGNILEFLESYVIQHFGDEEDYMRRTGCASYAEHKAVHEDFVRQFIQFKTTYDPQAHSAALALKVQSWIADWLINHVGGLDKRLAEHTVAAANQ